MNVQNTVKGIRLRIWAQQVHECQQSGLSIRKWCETNGVEPKTYYYRRKRVREELLEYAGPGSSLQVGDYEPKPLEMPVFAAFQMPRTGRAAVTVQVGAHVAEVHNGADAETVEGVLRALSRL
jgi:hypothetical protein